VTIEAQQGEIGQMQAWRLAWGSSAPAQAAKGTPKRGGHGSLAKGMNH